MPLDKKKLMAHLSASKTKPTMPNSPAIKQAEKLGQQAKKATGVSKVEREVTSHTNNLDSSPDVKAVAEAYLSKALMKKLLDGSKLTSEEQKAVAAVCKVVEYL